METISAQKIKLGKKLFALALTWSRAMPGTQKEKLAQVAAIKGRKKIIDGSKSQRSAMDAVEVAANGIKELRKQKKARYSGMTHGQPICKKTPRCFGEKSLRERLIAFKIINFRRCFEYRVDERLIIDITNTPQQVGVWKEETLNWDYYSKRCKYPKKEVSTHITIPYDWGMRVRRDGIAQVDGMTMIDAHRLDDQAGIKSWAARWIVQGRGYALSVASGYIASIDGVYYRAATLDKAVRGVARKTNTIIIDKKMTATFSDAGIASVINQYPDLSVCVDDARAVYACSYGITSWCNEVGINEQDGCVMLAKMYAAYKMRPAPEARAAILYAIKRQIKIKNKQNKQNKQNLLTLAA